VQELDHEIFLQVADEVALGQIGIDPKNKRMEINTYQEIHDSQAK